jgi:hypothetical protein
LKNVTVEFLKILQKVMQRDGQKWTFLFSEIFVTDPSAGFLGFSYKLCSGDGDKWTLLIPLTNR